MGPEMRVCVLINPATADWNARAPICERKKYLSNILSIMLFFLLIEAAVFHLQE